MPLDALYISAPIENFLWRIENALLREGGFAMVSGIPGQGKSVVMRLLEKRISRLAPNERQIAVINHPQSNVADFYRELGDHFNIVLKPSNRWMSFKALRERWLEYLSQSRRRSIVLIDEAQECSPAVLNELRLMSSHCFDSQMLLCIVLAGDDRLPEKMRRDDLLPLGSRIRIRLALEPQTPEELRAYLDHMLEAAGNAALMTEQLRTMLCEHCAGNPRVLMSKAGDLLLAAAKQDLPQLDEKLYYQTFPTSAPQSNAAPGRKHRVEELHQPMNPEAVPFILEVPVLDDETVDAVHSFMLDLLTQFENHYFGQLHRHQQHLASLHREAGNQGGPLDTDTELDEDLND